MNRMIKKRNELLTPCYIIDKKVFHDNVDTIRDAFKSKWGENVLLGYSIKTNHFPWLLKEAYEMGFMAEAVSGDEVKLALLEGYSPNNIIFNGPQKKKKDIELLLTKGGIVNIDNFSDIEMIREILSESVSISGQVGIRINFDLEKECAGETTAGNDVSRFGFCLENGDVDRAINILQTIGIPISGLHMHFSTKSRSNKVFSKLASCAVKIINDHILEDLQYIDIGGGFFGGQNNPNYPSMDEYAESVCGELLKSIDPKKTFLVLEPGASILATAIEYMTEIINERYIRDTKILTTDGSVLDINPFMSRRIPCIVWDINQEEREIIPRQIVCGATCMENDRFISLEQVHELKVKDRMIISYAGAYTMAFNNNFINIPPKVYLKMDDGWEILRMVDSTISTVI